MFPTAKEHLKLKLNADKELQDKIDRETFKQNQKIRHQHEQEDNVFYNVDTLYNELVKKAEIELMVDLTQIKWEISIQHYGTKQLTKEVAMGRLIKAGKQLADKLYVSGYDCKVSTFITTTSPYSSYYYNYHVKINIVATDR